jgi:DNA-binding transcriptional ArsR family regulator
MKDDVPIAPVAAAIGDPARARMLCALLDGRARTSTELAMLAGVTASTASTHLTRLKAQRLVDVRVQGKHRYYTLDRSEVASALEALSVVAGGTPFVPSTPAALREARTCYDHLAGTLAVALFDRFMALGWLTQPSPRRDELRVTAAGRSAFAALTIDVDAAEHSRRRFAFACLDWSERRPHLGGALGAAVLSVARRRRWVLSDLDSRIVRVTAAGRRELRERFGVTSPLRD